MPTIRTIADATATQEGTLTSGSAQVNGLDTSLLEGALYVAGAGIPRDALVKSIDSDSQVTLNRLATAAGPQTLTFGLEPITLAEAKLHVLAAVDSDDSLIARLITSARQLAEGWFSRAFVSTQYRMTAAGFGSINGTLRSYGWPYYNHLKIEWADVLDVTSLTYLDRDGITQVFDGFEFFGGPPARVVPIYGSTWPAVRTRPEAVQVDFTAGYGPTAASVPAVLKSGLLLVVGHLYDNREATSALTLQELPTGAQALLSMAHWGCTP